jgi:hypothetical protein
LAILNGCVTPLSRAPVLQHEANLSAHEAVMSQPNGGANPDGIRPGENIGEIGIKTPGAETQQLPDRDFPDTEQSLSPQAQKHVLWCLLAGPLCAALLLYVGSYAASMAAVCTPVAAITTPMRSNGFKEEFSQCMRGRQ